MQKSRILSRISWICGLLILLAIYIPTASAVFDDYGSSAIPCCPNYANYPDYPYGVDPYYQFPAYCLCPFLDASLERFSRWNIPYSYWEWVIQNQDSSCTTCSGSTSSGSTTISYSNTPIIIPERDSLISGYEATSVSFKIKSKDEIIAKYSK
jgi:hypothetical protein